MRHTRFGECVFFYVDLISPPFHTSRPSGLKHLTWRSCCTSPNHEHQKKKPDHFLINHYVITVDISSTLFLYLLNKHLKIIKSIVFIIFTVVNLPLTGFQIHKLCWKWRTETEQVMAAGQQVRRQLWGQRYLWMDTKESRGGKRSPRSEKCVWGSRLRSFLPTSLFATRIDALIKMCFKVLTLKINHTIYLPFFQNNKVNRIYVTEQQKWSLWWTLMNYFFAGRTWADLQQME